VTLRVLGPALLLSPDGAGEKHDDEPGDGHHYRNALGILLGGTYEGGEEDTFLTIGLEYDRQGEVLPFEHRWGPLRICW